MYIPQVPLPTYRVEELSADLLDLACIRADDESEVFAMASTDNDVLDGALSEMDYA